MGLPSAVHGGRGCSSSWEWWSWSGLGCTAIRRLPRSKLDTPNPVVLFQDLATNGPRVPATVEASSRNTYGRALSQFVLDGTGLCLGFTLAFAGLFIRANQHVSRQPA